MKERRKVEIKGRDIVLLRDGKTEKKVSLGAFFANCHFLPQETPLLPPGTRFYAHSGKRTIFVVEQPPQVRTIKWQWGGRFDENGEWKPFYRNYSLAFPYVIFVVEFLHRAIDNLFVYYRHLPLGKIEDELYEPNLPNIYNEEGDSSDYCRVCLDDDLEIDLNLPLSEKVKMVISNFWESIFCRDESQFFYQAQHLDKRISSLKAWQKETKRNSLFSLEVKWKKARRTLECHIKRSRKGAVDREKIIDIIYQTKEVQ